MNRDARTREPAGRPASLVERLADDMVGRWHAGDRTPAEHYLDRYPALRDEPEAALELLAEELALRAEHGLPVDADEMAARFPRWAAQVRALVECQRVLGPDGGPRFPDPGTALGEFHLLSELGRGAHGRVYLAAQPLLSGRPVVLKLGPATGHEHLSLARLQHTHIVPLYSAHEFRDTGLRGLCLPYFGGEPLSAVLSRVRDLSRPAVGKDLLPASDPDDASPPVHGPAWGLLERAAYADGVAWVGAGLADALQYAHDRGLLHLDLKPSNVLVAADGTPMLLDFHLARPPLRAGDPAPAWLGGTPGYMPPEQLAAVEAVRNGRPVPADLDGRADVFALGVVLTEALRAGNIAAGVGLADVLARATSPDTAVRYPTAAALAADLRRHLAARPLKGVRNRSLRERWAKWRRRRPHALPLGFALLALVVAGLALFVRADRQADRAAVALGEAEAGLRDGRYAEAAAACRGGEALLEGLPFQAALRTQLRDVGRAAERGRLAEELHLLCEHIRPLYAAELVTPGQARTVHDRCLDLWANRETIARTLDGGPADRGPRWRADLLDVAVLAAHLGPRAVSATAAPAAHRRSLAVLDEAESLLHPGPLLDLERVPHARALGQHAAADAALDRGLAATPRTAWEHVAVGRAALAAGDVDRAAAATDRALRLDPRSVWAGYYAGLCRLKADDPAGALAAFSGCVALAPDSAWCRHNRGLAYAALGRPAAAVADFDRAVDIDPRLGAAWLARAGVLRREKRYAEALADLRQAASAGVRPAEVAYQRAVVEAAAGEREAARANLRECLTHDPAHAPARELLEKLGDGM
jgi:tetratricopeptide (TPR) repeat protein